MIKAVAFDLDDTIISTDAHIESALKGVFDTYGQALRTDAATLKESNNRALQRLLPRLQQGQITLVQFSYLIWFEMLRDLGRQPTPALVAGLYEALQDEIVERITLNEGFKALFKDLKKMNLHIGVLSNGIFLERVNKLRQVDLLEDVDILVTSDVAGIDKPNETPFRMLLDLLDCHSNEALYVGNDLKQDYLPAKGLGMEAALYSRLSDGANGPDVVIVRNGIDILNLVKRLNEEL